jgi:tetratricopeptide (TPR) repeat protein
VSLVLALLLEASLPTGTLAVFPPDGVSSGPDAVWVGEAVSEALPRALAILGAPVVERSDRLQAEEALGIPLVSLTRATCIRIGDALGASRLVVGGYEMKDGELTLSLRLLDVGRGTLSAPFISSTAQEKVLESIYGLAWDIALSSSTPPAMSRGDFLSKVPQVSFEAFKTYGQGLASTDAKNRVKLLKRSLSLDPRFDGTRISLGRLHLQSKEYQEAAKVLAQVPSSSPFARRARFLEGVAFLGLGRYKEAQLLYSELALSQVSPAVLNNEAVALLRLGGKEKASEALKRAVEMAPGASDLVFNLGWALLVEGEAEPAVFWLRGVVREDARDTNARLLLVWALSKAKREEEANEEWNGLTERAPSLGTMSLPDFTRRFERILPSERLLLLDQDRRSDVELAEVCLARADKLLASSDPAGALRELVRAATLDPYGARVHQRMATLLAARGDKQQAIDELRTSLWCKEDTGVRVELMILLKELGKEPEARAQAARILRTQPGNEAALRVLPPS